MRYADKECHALLFLLYDNLTHFDLFFTICVIMLS
jgi:hypothetical protein